MSGLKFNNVLMAATPASGKVILYAKGGLIYKKGSDGVEYLLGGSVITGTSMPSDGWVSDSNTWSFSSEDAPSYVISINADVTTTLCVGMKIKLTHSASTKYFIITAVGAFSGGATLVTVYGGTDYTLAAGAITAPFYSNVRIPIGFPQNPATWTVEVVSNLAAGVGSPASGTWYNASGIYITIPVGLWDVSYNASLNVADTSLQIFRGFMTLSTGNAVESDADMTSWVNYVNSTAAQNLSISGSLFRTKPILLVGKTIEYLLVRTTANGVDSLSISGNGQRTIIRARSAYL